MSTDYLSQSFEVLDLTVMNAGISRLLDDVAHNIRGAFVEYTQFLGSKHEKDIDWWTGNIGSRNSQASNLYANCCKLYLVKHLIKEGVKIDRIVVDSQPLKKAILRMLRVNSYSCSVEYKTDTLNGLVNRIKTQMKRNSLVSVLYFVFTSIRQNICARASKKYSTYEHDTNEPVILLDNFVIENSFVNQKFTDRYYPHLREYLTETECNRIYFAPTYYQIDDYQSMFKNMRMSNEHFLVREDYLKPSDYFYAFTHVFRTKKFIKNPPDFLGMEIDDLLKDQNHLDSVSQASFEALLKYRFVMRLNKENVRFALIVNWFENQVIDHGFNAGFRKWYPDTPLVGFQLLPHPDHYLSVYPTEQEKRNSVIPKEVAVMGNGFRDVVKTFCPSLEVTVAPALRFKHLWNVYESTYDPGVFRVLVALPYFMDEAIGILKMLDVITSELPENFIFHIKTHPTNSIEKTKQAFGVTWPGVFQFASETFDVLVAKTDIVISSSSSVCLETIAKGTPVIVIANAFGITYKYIPEAITQDIWRMCYTADDLKEALVHYSKRDNETVSNYKELGRSIRDIYFEPINEVTVRRFLKLEN
ncbi:MAG: hypothetical protein GXY34_05955 [Syntrophomonadaceae bacterium]|nr:hypothetical protein [Syntrophomonadaceae bacterium]